MKTVVFQPVSRLSAMLGLLPRVAVFSEADHLEELEEAGFRVEQCWRKDGAIAIFVVARMEDRG